MDLAAILPRLSGELATMAEVTERIAERLCADEQVVATHLPALQQFDLLAQQQAAIAALLRALSEGKAAERALGEVPLEALAQRLGRAA